MTLPAGRHPIAAVLPEPWAVEWGEDRYGVFTGFAFAGVIQRMRWIPPGRFLMGSPEGEAGRFDGEGPQHEVELSRGVWLGETPCTQALWQAVMGTNPSEYISADRPVEQVSWDDCKGFVERLNILVPGLAVRLPTEAEWERACRAGTTGATWVGELEVRGENDAPQLDAIAWYGGNSGNGFELPNGSDSSTWPSKQFPHTRAGTRPVGRKLPNPLGLFDMLGNVYEWCEDWHGLYDPALVVDPRGPASGSDRVRRGGSWRSYAGSIRAAARHALAPARGADYLGLRLARSQPSAPGAEPSAASDRSRRR
jgi:formylglycine-generating enzyme required for sulfatase activity